MQAALRRRRTQASPQGERRRGAVRFDYLIVGAGFAGSVLAERFASQLGKRVLLCDKRPHVGGNAYDCHDDAGVLVHRYGPHIFHTGAPRIFQYLSQFTEWRPYEHRVRAAVDGMLAPFPINVDTVNQLYGTRYTPEEVEAFFARVAVSIAHCKTSEDAVVSKVGRELYEKFFRSDTKKQWDMDASELNAAVAAGVPARTNHDDRYFTDKLQAMPLRGYTRMFEDMVDHRNIWVVTNIDYRDLVDEVRFGEMIYTGPIDPFFGHRYGNLPYRSIRSSSRRTIGRCFNPRRR